MVVDIVLQYLVHRLSIALSMSGNVDFFKSTGLLGKEVCSVCVERVKNILPPSPVFKDLELIRLVTFIFSPHVRSKGRKFERARGRRKSRGYKN